MKKKKIHKEKRLTVPNLLSFLRLVLFIPFLHFAYQYSQNHETNALLAAIGIILLAALTDILDGYLARLFNQETKLGQYLDPVCDKITSISALLLLTLAYDFPLWALSIYLVREILGTCGGAFLHFRRGLQGIPNYWGKLGVALTALLVMWYISLPWLKANFPWGHWFLDPSPLTYLWLGILAISMISYTRSYGSFILHNPKSKSSPP